MLAFVEAKTAYVTPADMMGTPRDGGTSQYNRFIADMKGGGLRRLFEDKPVLLRMQSKDVIHSFYLPNFRTKQDTFPGAITRLWFQAKQPGVFDIGCAQHCGANHYKMRGQLTVDTADRYADWEKGEVAAGMRRFDPGDVEAHWGWDWEY